MLKKAAILAVGVFLSLFLYANSRAEIPSSDLPQREGIKVGEVIFHSAFKTGVQFDSNIYLTDKSEKYDTITLLNPSIGFTLPLNDNSISVEYDAAINEFARFTENNHIDHRVQALAEINLTDYKVTVSDLFRRFKDRAGSEDVNRIKRQTNDFRLGVATQLDQFAFDVSYSNKLVDYLTDQIIIDPLNYKDKDYITHIADVEASYRFQPKTSVLWDTSYGYIDYYKSSLPPDSYYIESLLGIRGEWFRNMVINLKGGVKFQQYDSSVLYDDDNYCSFVAMGGFDYLITDKDTFSLSVNKENYESTYNRMNYYEVNSLGLNFAHKFRKLTPSVFGLVQVDRYPGESTELGETRERRDKLYSAGCALDYYMKKWVSLKLKYEYKRRTSNFATYDYLENLTTLAGTMGF